MQQLAPAYTTADSHPFGQAAQLGYQNSPGQLAGYSVEDVKLVRIFLDILYCQVAWRIFLYSACRIAIQRGRSRKFQERIRGVPRVEQQVDGSYGVRTPPRASQNFLRCVLRVRSYSRAAQPISLRFITCSTEQPITAAAPYSQQAAYVLYEEYFLEHVPTEYSLQPISYDPSSSIFPRNQVSDPSNLYYFLLLIWPSAPALLYGIGIARDMEDEES